MAGVRTAALSLVRCDDDDEDHRSEELPDEFHNGTRPPPRGMVDDKKAALARLKASRQSRRAEGGAPEWNATPEPPAAARCASPSVRARRWGAHSFELAPHPPLLPLLLRSSTKRRPKHSAATSHRANDAYMALMEDGVRAMGISDRGDDDQSPSNTPTTTTSHLGKLLGDGPANSPGELVDPAIPRGWYGGPNDAAGVRVALTDQPVCVGSVNPKGTHLVVGSTDHALYEVQLATGTKTRTLHSNAYGHREWVTCVRHLPDGRFVSGGMDGKLCVWSEIGARCVELGQGHSGSIAKVEVSRDGTAVVSAGYDKTVRCWSTKTRRETASLEGHRAPVLELAWSSDGGLASGDRDGRMLLWDAQFGQSGKKDAVGKRKVCEGGHVTALAWTRRVGYEAVMRGGDVLVSGGQDGVVKVWDFRIAGQGACVAAVEAHRRSSKNGGAGAGAVGDVCQTRGGRIVTGGADGRLAVLDPRMGYERVGAGIATGDFVYSLVSVGPIVACGTGAGAAHVVDVDGGDEPTVLYALGANKAAVRVLATSGDGRHLACAGDDGSVMCYAFD